MILRRQQRQILRSFAALGMPAGVHKGPGSGSIPKAFPIAWIALKNSTRRGVLGKFTVKLPGSFPEALRNARRGSQATGVQSFPKAFPIA